MNTDLNKEFSNKFDILYNNIMSNQAPGLDLYEKSVFLSLAQEDIVRSLYNGKNPVGESFESTEELRRSLSELIKTDLIKEFKDLTTAMGISETPRFFILPEDVWFITYESVVFSSKDKCIDGLKAVVVPVTQDSFNDIEDNPFRGANKRRVLRLDYSGNMVELVSKYDIKEYKVRYLIKPSPIILEDLEGDLNIEGETKESECKLNSLIHDAIIERAVKLASIAYKS